MKNSNASRLAVALAGALTGPILACSEGDGPTAGASSSTANASASASASTSASSGEGGSASSSGGSGGMSNSGGAGGAGGVEVVFPHTLYVAHEGALVAYDVATGKEVVGSVDKISGPRTMLALADGTVLLNNTKLDQIVAVGGNPPAELARYGSSAMLGKKPAEGYITPTYNGKSYWVALNDGNNTAGSTTATFVDVMAGSPTWLKQAGEVTIPNGHHQAAFSATQERMVVSSFSDCQKVLEFFDYSDVTNIKSVASMAAIDLGFDGSTTAKTCDVSGSAGVAMKPHGCATSKQNGKVYCNIGGVGLIAVADIDANPPTYKSLATNGTGSGYTRALPGTPYIYTLQSTPREGQGGVACQVGQLVAINTANDTIAKQVPLLYKGPDCTDALVGTDEESASPNWIRTAKDGKTMFISLGSSSKDPNSRVRQEIVMDLTTPATPVQLPSIKVGQSTGERGMALSGDGKLLFLADVVDGTVTEIDVATLKVVTAIKVNATPLMLATFGSVEGPSASVGPVF